MAMPIKDPTENVMKLVAETITRLDDLRKSESLRIDQYLQGESRRITELMAMQSNFAAKLSEAEAKRIDAIRAVDATAISIANDRASAQASVLANQVSTSAETLRSLVATTAAQQAIQLQALTTQLTDRIALLEKGSYENRGTGTGRGEMWAWILGGIIGLFSIINVLYTVLHS